MGKPNPSLTTLNNLFKATYGPMLTSQFKGAGRWFHNPSPENIAAAIKLRDQKRWERKCRKLKELLKVEV